MCHNVVEERGHKSGPNLTGLFTYTLGFLHLPNRLEIISKSVECIRVINTKYVRLLIKKSPVQDHCFLHRSGRLFRFPYVVEMERQVFQRPSKNSVKLNRAALN